MRVSKKYLGHKRMRVALVLVGPPHDLGVAVLKLVYDYLFVFPDSTHLSDILFDFRRKIYL